MNNFSEYHIWKRYHSTDEWTQTTYTLLARTDKEAQSKLAMMFASCGFSSMSLVAVIAGESPNG